MIKAPVPGFNPEDVEITFSDGMLTITATRREEREEPEGQYLRREIAFGNYRRRTAQPADMTQAGGRDQASDGGVASGDVQSNAEAQQQSSGPSRSEASSRS
jgi:HSP20 family protein